MILLSLILKAKITTMKIDHDHDCSLDHADDFQDYDRSHDLANDNDDGDDDDTFLLSLLWVTWKNSLLFRSNLQSTHSISDA